MGTQKSKLTALLITLNEEKHINDVINNVNFADEIIVVDAFSSDNTIEILKGFNNVKVIQRTFKNFADQRNFAIAQASNDWILFIDADERIPETLKSEILSTINSKTELKAFMFKRRFFFNKKIIRFSGLQSDTTFRLFKKKNVMYDEAKIVHEQPIINGESGILKNYMLHYCYTSADNYKQKMEYYATLKAKELFLKGKRANGFHFVFRPVYKFFINYIIRLGFLDGKEGFSICYLSAYGVWYRYKQLQKLATLPEL